MDFIKIIRNNLYSKYKSGLINFYISKTNSILFKPEKGYYKQFIGNYLKEMYIYSDNSEFLQKYFNINDSNFKLKVLSYIYFHNFKYSPNYLILDNDILNIMCKLLREKQNLIDRNIATNCIVYEKSRNKYNRYKYYKNDDENIIFNDMNMNKSNFSSFSNNNQNIEKNNLYEIKNKNYINKNFISYTRLNEAKNKEKEINISIESIKKLVKKFKNVKINIINKNNINFTKSINSKDSINKLNIKNIQNNKNKNKNKFTSSKKLILNNKNNIRRELIKSRNSNYQKINKYKLSVDDFKENLRKSKKSLVQKYLDNFWKENKNFVTNLIENKNIINFNKTIFHKRYFSTNNSENFNNFLLMKSVLSNKSNNKSNKSIKMKLKSNSFNKNKFPKKVEFNNTLIRKIQNNSYFMKNKNFYCISDKENKNNRNLLSVKSINFSYKYKS